MSSVILQFQNSHNSQKCMHCEQIFSFISLSSILGQSLYIIKDDYTQM